MYRSRVFNINAAWMENESVSETENNQQPMNNATETTSVHLTKCVLDILRYPILRKTEMLTENFTSAKPLLSVKKFFNMHALLLCASYVFC